MEYHTTYFFKNLGAERNSKDNPVSFQYFADEVTDDHKPGMPLDLPDIFNM